MTPQVPRAARALLAAIVSGLLYRLALPEPAWWWLAWVCLVPLFSVVRPLGVLPAALLGIVFGAVWAAWHGVAGYNAATGFFQGSRASALGTAVLATAYFASWAGLRCAVSGLLLHRYRWRFAPAMVTGWLVGDLLHTYLGLLAGNLIGATQAAAPVFLQTAELGGTPAVGVVVVAVNALLAEACTAPGSRKRACLIAAAIFAGNAAYGGLRLHQIETAAAGGAVRQLRVALVQPNVRHVRDAGPDVLAARRIPDLVWDAFHDDDAPDVVLLPEGAASAAGGLAALGPVPASRWLMTGLMESPPPGERGARPRNTAVWVSGEGGRDSTAYVKRRLFPIGERPVLGLERVVLSPQEQGRWELPGPKVPAVFEGAGWRVTPLICFEVLFANTVHDSARAGADWLAVLSNDEWFDAGDEPLQHFMHTAVVAVQTRRPVARVTNTGVSGGFDAAGRPLALEIRPAGPPQVGAGRPRGAERPRPAPRPQTLPRGATLTGYLTVRLGAAEPLAGPLPPWWPSVPLLAFGIARRRRIPVGGCA